jgi:hypothetical protein
MRAVTFNVTIPSYLVGKSLGKLTEAAVWAAKATAFANKCPLDSLVVVDPGAKRLFVRDTTALPARKKMPKSKSRVIGLEAAAQPAAPAPAAAAGSAGAAPKRRHSLVRGPAATPSELATARGRAKTARLANRAEAEADEHRVHRWLAERSSGAAPQTTASERLAALKERLAAKQSLAAG